MKSIRPSARDRVVRGILGFVMTAGLGLAGAAAAAAQEHFDVSGASVAIYNLVGRVQVVAGSGSDITVDITRGGPDAAKLRVETGVINGRNTLRVIYPDRRIISPRDHGWWNTSMKVNDDGTFSDRTSMGHTVTITNRGKGLEAHADLLIKVPAGKQLAVYGAVGEMNASGISSDLRLDSGSSAVTADEIKGSLVVDVGSGSVDVSNVTGNLDVDTGSGDVNMTGVRGDLIKVDTGSGTVRGKDLKAQNISVDTGSGSVELASTAAGSISADTGSGDVTLALTADAQDVSIDTGSGSVELTVPSQFGARLAVEVGSGDIDIRIPMAEIRKDEDSVRGRIGDGAGRIRIETGSGGVTVAAAN